MRSRRWLGGCAVSLATAVLAVYPPNRLTAQSREVLLATTTSTRDAGLLDSLLPVFQRQTGYRVKVIAVGSGQALAMGRRGDADVVLSHAPEAERVLVDSGQGMGATLQLADEKHGYTLTDRATYLAWRDKLQLVPLVEGDPLLYNVYHVLELNPKNAPRINVAGGRAFAEFLVSPGTQALIGAFDRARFGRSLFVPDADKPDSW